MREEYSGRAAENYPTLRPCSGAAEGCAGGQATPYQVNQLNAANFDEFLSAHVLPAPGSCLPRGAEFEAARGQLNLTDPLQPVTSGSRTVPLVRGSYAQDTDVPEIRDTQCRPCLLAMMCEAPRCAPPEARYTAPQEPDDVESRGELYPQPSNLPSLDITHYNFTKCYSNAEAGTGTFTEAGRDCRVRCNVGYTFGNQGARLDDNDVNEHFADNDVAKTLLPDRRYHRSFQRWRCDPREQIMTPHGRNALQ